MSRQVVVREAAEDVRNLDHGRCPPSHAGHELVENTLERGPGRLGQVHVDGGRRDVGVAGLRFGCFGPLMFLKTHS